MVKMVNETRDDSAEGSRWFIRQLNLNALAGLERALTPEQQALDCVVQAQILVDGLVDGKFETHALRNTADIILFVTRKGEHPVEALMEKALEKPLVSIVQSMMHLRNWDEYNVTVSASLRNLTDTIKENLRENVDGDYREEELSALLKQNKNLIEKFFDSYLCVKGHLFLELVTFERGINIGL